MSGIILEQGESRKRFVRKMFNDIAHRYDFLNHFLSLGIDVWWRRQTVDLLRVDESHTILDMACGTGDLAIAAHTQKKCRVVGADLAGNMLRIGQDKLRRRGLDDHVKLVLADGEQLPFAGERFDAVMIAFGIRNMGDMHRALAEMYRVLKKGGQLAVLEFSLPTFPPIRMPYLFYFNKILPGIGRVVSKDKKAYRYLPASVEKFPTVSAFIAELRSVGFNEIHFKKLLTGVAVIYTAIK